MLVLHIIDPSTPEEALEMLAAITRRVNATHRVLALGHHSLVFHAARAGVPQELLHFQRALGWWDPTGWRGLFKIIKQLAPTHLHAWGVPGAGVASKARHFQGSRLLTLADTPAPRRLRLLRRLTTRLPWVLTASSQSIHRALSQGLALPPARLHQIRPGIDSVATSGLPNPNLRKQLGLSPADGPILLVGGPATAAARRDHALWAAAIVQQIYPHTRVLVRSGSRPGPSDHDAGDLLRRFSHTLPESRMTLFAPHHVPWSVLLEVADLFLITPDRPIPTASILHAMAGGVPVLGTAIDPITELIQDNKTGLLAPPGEPRAIAARLEEFLTHPALRPPLVEAARAHVATHFSQARMIERFSELYRRSAQAPEQNQNFVPPTSGNTAQDSIRGVASGA